MGKRRSEPSGLTKISVLRSSTSADSNASCSSSASSESGTLSPVPQATSTLKKTTSSTDALEKLAIGEYKLVKKPKSKSLVWSSFLVFTDHSGKEVGFVRCIKCLACLSHSDSIGTSSLKRHAEKCNSSALKAPPAEANSLFKDSMIDFCATDMRPFEIAAGLGFQNLIQASIDIGKKYGNVDAKQLIPHPTTLSRGIGERAESCREVVMSKVRDAIREGRFSATTDMWTDDHRHMHYSTVTGHFVNDNFEMESHVICTVKFPNESATGENIRAELKRQLNALGVTDDDFLKIEWVTDGGKNIHKALENHQRNDCLGHLLNTVLQNSFKLKYKDLRQHLVNSNQETLQTVQNIEEAVRLVKSSSNTSLKKKLHLPSSSVSYVPMLLSYKASKDQIIKFLQEKRKEEIIVSVEDSVVDDLIYCLTPLDTKQEKSPEVTFGQLPKLREHCALDVADSTLLVSLKVDLECALRLMDLFSVIDKSKSLVAFFKRSGLVKLLSKTLKQENDTRWNTILTLLNSLYDVYDEVQNVLEQEGKSQILEGIEKDFLKKVCDFLGPFKDMTDKLQGENYPTLPYGLLAFEKLKTHCKPRTNDCALISAIREKAGHVLVEKIEKSITMDHKVATFLWPRYRKLTRLDTEERNKVISHVKALCNAVEDESVLDVSSGPKRLCFDKDFEDWEDLEEGERNNALIHEVDRYIHSYDGDDTDLLLWWKSKQDVYPLLSKLALRFLGKPATSAPSERVFSAAGFIIQERRSSLSPESVDHLIFLHFHLMRLGKTATAESN